MKDHDRPDTRVSERVDPFSVGALRYHVPLLVGIAVCTFAGWFELSRARDGHTIAWVYAVEWPCFAVAGTVIWWRIITNRDDPGLGGPDTTAASRQRAVDTGIAEDDPGLVAWHKYLRDVRHRDQAREANSAD